MQALYQRVDQTFVPGPGTGSPWSAETQHGGPAAALLAHAVESAVEPSLFACRLTIDLSRPLPKKPLSIEVRPVRTGRRIAVVDATIACQGRPSSHGRALFLLPSDGAAGRRTAAREPSGAAIKPVEESVPGPLVDSSRGVPPGFHTTVEVRWAESEGPRQSAWFRLPMAVIEGETNSPLMRAAAVSDFANALARRAVRGAGPSTTDFVNADLTLHLSRPPIGEWIGLRLDRLVEEKGVSYSVSTLYDTDSLVGLCTQTRLAI